MTYISSQSLTSPLRASILKAQAALTQAQTEIGSGAPADLGLTLGARTGHALSMQSSIDRLSVFTQTNAVATTRLDTTSNALDTMLTRAQSIASALTAATTAGGTTAGLTTKAKAALQDLVAGLNTSVGGQSVFAGIDTATTPVADYFSATVSSAKGAVDSAFQSAFGTSQTSASAGSISGSDMQSFLGNQFAALFSDSSWGASWSSASSQTISSTVAPSQALTTSVSANEPAFRQIAQAYTMLTEFTGDNMSADAKAAVVAKATSLINSGIAALTQVQTSVGVAQAAITTAQTRNTTQASVLKTSVGDLESVDPYALSSKITSLQTQLEASYQLTSRLQSLSLVNYLNG